MEWDGVAIKKERKKWYAIHNVSKYRGLGAVHIGCQPPRGEGKGIRQFKIFSEKGVRGRGVGQFMIFC